MDLLGNSLTSIAKEKAGIIKPNKPVVIGEIIPETKDVFYETAKKNNAELHLAATVPLEMNKTWNATNGTRTFQSPNLPQPFQLPLPGSYQFNNVQTVIKTCEVISKHGFHISPLAIQQGLEKTIQHTQLQGRWQTLSQHPLTIADTAHNVHGFEKAMAQLSEHPAPQKHLVLGFVNDKDVMAMLAFVPKSWIIYATSPKIPRAMPIHTLASHLKKHNYNFKSYRSVKRALHYAQKNAKPHEIVYVGGSTFVVAEVV
jgi:dihydrofolate synthase/folylpolyglutamate synthase